MQKIISKIFFTIKNLIVHLEYERFDSFTNYSRGNQNTGF